MNIYSVESVRCAECNSPKSNVNEIQNQVFFTFENSVCVCVYSKIVYIYIYMDTNNFTFH